jgi:Sulfotransferase family
VVKGCAHQFQLKDLFAEFPDAICIWPHRDPVDVHQSTLAISSVLYHAITNGRMDWHQFARGYMQATRAGIDRVLADPLVDDPRIVHLRFKDLAKDPVGTIKRIYGKFNLAYTAELEQRMRTWLDDPAHRSDRYGRYPYSLEPFGLEREAVARMFADYSERFGLV